MKAGFCKGLINPSIGTTMSGWQGRDMDHGCDGIHDDINARALYLSEEKEEMLIIAMDILFLSRDEADRFKGAVGRALDLRPSQILLNSSHTHSGPKTGKWCYDAPLEPVYIDQLEQTVVNISIKAKELQKEADVFVGMTFTDVSVSRRFPGENGKILFKPYRDGVTCDALPICAIKDKTNKMICLVHSVSCHASTHTGYDISADYPGVSCKLIGEHIGADVAMFLQGCGGDTKAGDRDKPSFGETYEDAQEAGRKIAEAVISVVDNGLEPSKPELKSYSIEMKWPREPDMAARELETVAEKNNSDPQMRLNALNLLEREQKKFKYPDYIPVTMQGIKLAENMRMIALEGEAVAAWGNIILDFYGEGVTFPLSYSNGTQMYLPTDKMLKEGGYEADSFYQYRQPSRFAEGLEKVVLSSLDEMAAHGIV